MELGKIIDELGFRMRLLRAGQEDQAHTGDITERDMLLLEMLNERGRMTVSEISASYSNASESTISTNITKLWRNKKLVSKTINPENQRVTFVELTEKGVELVKKIRQMRSERLATLFKAMEITEEESKVMERVMERAVRYFDNVFNLRQEGKTNTILQSSGSRDDG
jgi:DNA-binding MarR family transcriptional regulator